MAQVLAHVVFDVEPVHRDRFIATAGEVMRASQAEAGCILYHYGADLTDPRLFHITEIWESQAALDAHLATPHARESMGITMQIARITSLRFWAGPIAEMQIPSPQDTANP